MATSIHFHILFIVDYSYTYSGSGKYLSFMCPAFSKDIDIFTELQSWTVSLRSSPTLSFYRLGIWGPEWLRSSKVSSGVKMDLMRKGKRHQHCLLRTANLILTSEYYKNYDSGSLIRTFFTSVCLYQNKTGKKKKQEGMSFA